MSNETKKLYAERDAMELDQIGGHYFKHVMAMTSESLHSKSDIAAELGWRDCQIEQLEQQLADSQREFRSADATIENLQMQVEKLAAENEGLKNVFGPGDAVLNFLTIALRHTTYDQIDLDDVTLAFKMSLPETPATDAFLAEVRAQGIDECVRQLVISDDDDFSDAPNICAMVAHQLRKGVQS